MTFLCWVYCGLYSITVITVRYIAQVISIMDVVTLDCDLLQRFSGGALMNNESFL